MVESASKWYIYFFIYRAEEVESKPQDCNGEEKSFLMMSKLEWQDDFM